MDACIYAPFPEVYACVERLSDTAIEVGSGGLGSALAERMLKFRSRKASANNQRYDVTTKT